MDALLREMQEMDKFVQQPIAAPSVINEVSKLTNPDQLWGASGPKTDESLAEVKIRYTFERLFMTFVIFSSGSNH